MIDRQRLKVLHAREEERFLARTPKSRELFEKAKGVMPGMDVAATEFYKDGSYDEMAR